MDGKDFVSILDGFTMGQLWLNDVEIEIEGGANEVDALTLLRAYEDRENLDVQLALTQQFMLNKHVVFKRKGEEVLSFVYTGGDLGKSFASAPYLLKLAMRFSLGLMLKKLTPPSEGSETEERQ